MKQNKTLATMDCSHVQHDLRRHCWLFTHRNTRRNDKDATT